MSSPEALALFDAEVARLHTLFPAHCVAVQGGAAQVQVRDNQVQQPQGLPVVALHGIGSGAASWLAVAEQLAQQQVRLLAWDAPGYGQSTPLAMPAPQAGDYAQRLLELLDALGIERCILVGHSLGALISSAAAQAASPLAQRIARLVMMSPARGYGATELAEKAISVRAGRLKTVQDLGIEGMAKERSARLVSQNAPPLQRAWVRWIMGQLHLQGYTQAVELLCGDDLLKYLQPAMPVQVLCGAEDVITPPTACQVVAQGCGLALELLAQAGHACYVEQPQAVAQVLLAQVRAAAQA